MDENIYIDVPLDYGHRSGSKFSHMTCKNIKKLHQFANSLGINKCWYENKKGMNRPHYDVKEYYFKEAIKKGAIILQRREWVTKMNEIFGEIYPQKKLNLKNN